MIVIASVLLAAVSFEIGIPCQSKLSPLVLAAEQVSAAQPSRTLVPAGTEIRVRLIDGIDADATAAGERFRASVDDPVIVGNSVVIPRNADATVQVVRAESRNDISVRLYNVIVDGVAYDIVSEFAQINAPRNGGAYTRRSVGLGALGAAIGGIAGGGTGAAIGAISGGGIGAATVAARGSRVQLPPETRLSFQLRGPIVQG